MPIYEFDCPCGQRETEKRNFADIDKPKVCFCGKDMRRIFSLPQPAIFRTTARQMALDGLNNKGEGMPDCDLKPMSQQAVLAGIDPPKRVIGKGFG